MSVLVIPEAGDGFGSESGAPMAIMRDVRIWRCGGRSVIVVDVRVIASSRSFNHLESDLDLFWSDLLCVPLDARICGDGDGGEGGAG